MSSLSLLARLVVLFAVLVCVVSGQSSDSSSSSSIVPPPIAPSSSSTPPPPVPTSVTSTPAALVSSSSSSSSAPIDSLPAPVLFSLSGCNNNATANATGVTDCDGQSTQSVITITGANFTASVGALMLSVRISCSNGGIYTPWVQDVTATVIKARTPGIDKSDANQECTLTVINPDAKVSNGLPLTFTSWATDIVDAVNKFLGMTMSVLVAVVVVMVVVLIVFVLCMLSCCCGVSLACLNICCPRRSQPTIVLSPQSSGYASMA